MSSFWEEGRRREEEDYIFSCIYAIPTISTTRLFHLVEEAFD